METVVYEGDLVVGEAKFALLVSRWNDLITSRLLDGAFDTILRHGGSKDQIDIVWAPGSYELPLVSKRLAISKKYDAVVALACVIRGGTPHFDYVASEVTKGLATVSLDTGVPISFGVLTTNSIEQAVERAGTKMGNKGTEATLAAIEMVNLLTNLPTS